jgi:hypothetical protein
MNIISARSAIVPGFIMLATATLLGCGSSSTPAAGTGGAKGTGTGGAAVTGTGGSTVAGTGGSTGTGGGPPPLLNYTFDTATQGLILNDYPDTGSFNLAGNYTTDGGTADAAGADAGTAIVKPTLEFDSTVGSPNPGSLKVTVTFTAYSQYVDVVANLPAPLDLTGKIVHAKLQLTSGLFSGGAQLHLTTGANYDSYVSAPFLISPTPGTFANAMLDLSTATPNAPMPPLNPAMVRQVGVQIYSGSPVAGVPLYPNAGMPVVFNVDTITD